MDPGSSRDPVSHDNQTEIYCLPAEHPSELQQPFSVTLTPEQDQSTIQIC